MRARVCVCVSFSLSRYLVDRSLIYEYSQYSRVWLDVLTVNPTTDCETC